MGSNISSSSTTEVGHVYSKRESMPGGQLMYCIAGGASRSFAACCVARQATHFPL